MLNTVAIIIHNHDTKMECLYALDVRSEKNSIGLLVFCRQATGYAANSH